MEGNLAHDNSGKEINILSVERRHIFREPSLKLTEVPLNIKLICIIVDEYLWRNMKHDYRLRLQMVIEGLQDWAQIIGNKDKIVCLSKKHICKTPGQKRGVAN